MSLTQGKQTTSSLSALDEANILSSQITFLRNHWKEGGGGLGRLFAACFIGDEDVDRCGIKWVFFWFLFDFSWHFF
jgi:hypothetical protein